MRIKWSMCIKHFEQDLVPSKCTINLIDDGDVGDGGGGGGACG